jgi:hypothetical protein
MSTSRCLLAVALVVVAGLPLGYALTRRVLLAVILAPLASAATATVAIMAMLAVGGPLVPWLVGTFLVQLAVVALLLTRWHPVPLGHAGWADALWLLVPLLPPFLLVLVPPDNWDANSIWWLHAGYFAQGADVARGAIAAPPLVFSHVGYPPLGSAPVAAVWALFSRGDLTVAECVSATVTFAGLASLAYCVRQLTGGAPALVSRLLAVGVALAAWATAPETVAGGQMDPLWSAVLVGAAALLLIGPRPLDQPVLAVALLTVAALTKNEGLTTAVIVAALATLRYWFGHGRTGWWRPWPVWIAVLAGGSWMLLVRALHPAFDATAATHVRGLLAGHPQLTRRIVPTAEALRGQVGTLVAVTVLVAVLGAVFLRRRRRALGYAPDVWFGLLTAGYTGTLMLVYVTSVRDLTWYLVTSITRTSLIIVLLCAVVVACWAAVALSPVPADTPVPAPHAEPEDDPAALVAAAP